MSREEIVKERKELNSNHKNPDYCDSCLKCEELAFIEGKLEGYDLAVKEIREWLVTRENKSVYSTKGSPCLLSVQDFKEVFK